MISIDGKPTRFKSKDIAWTNGGAGEAVFDNSFIPDQGPNGGVMVIDRIIENGLMNLTAATAVIQGEDLYRVFRYTTLTMVDGEKRVDAVPGDALRLINFAHLGAEATIEHQDFAISTGNVTVTAVVPLAKPFAFEPDDYSLPAYLMREHRIGMAQSTDLSLGASVVTVNSGSYWLIAECREEFGAIEHAVDCWSVQEFDTSTSGTIPVNGRAQDLYLFVKGASGGASLANVTDVFIPNIYAQPLLKHDLQQAYARARGQATNSFSTVGDPRSTDPFVASASGTLRAIAPLLCEGDKAHDAPESRTIQVKCTLGGALSLLMVVRATKRITAAHTALVKRMHRTNGMQVKTSGKTRRGTHEWTPDQLAYLPKKHYTVGRLSDGKAGRVPTRLFSGRAVA